MLIAGSTGSGKSACLNSFITSIIYKSSPDDVRLILIDPKRVEFNIYNGLPHLLLPEAVSEPEKAINAFNWAINEMERRYKLFQSLKVANILEFNASSEVASGEEAKLPYIVIIVDELADLMLYNKREMEEKIRRLSALARAAGIHLVIATQRPSVDVITGTIKTNLPSRIAFAVTNFADSKTILDQSGAENLLGRGDMLFCAQSMKEPIRVQGAYVTKAEVKAIVESAKALNPSVYDEEAGKIINFVKPPAEEATAADYDEEDQEDALLGEAIRLVIESGQASISMVQRRFSVGYARAARLIDQMELRKFISPFEGSKPRQVYITLDQWKELFGDK
jgi:S-DNA-T family DNA segregation ATPase FtsK/SpoIIIE